MTDYYNWIIERLAEWFMKLFFDPAYHFEVPVEKCSHEASCELIEEVTERLAASVKTIGNGYATSVELVTTILQEIYALLVIPMNRYNLQVAFNQWIN